MSIPEARWFTSDHTAPSSMSEAALELGKAQDEGVPTLDEMLDKQAAVLAAAKAIFESQKEHAVNRAASIQTVRKGHTTTIVAWCGRTFELAVSRPAHNAPARCLDCAKALLEFQKVQRAELAKREREETEQEQKQIALREEAARGDGERIAKT